MAPSPRTIPKLSSKPHPKGGFYSAYRVPDKASPCFKYFGHDRRQAELEYATWVTETFQVEVDVVRKPSPGEVVPSSIADVTSGYLTSEQRRVRPASRSASRHDGLISPLTYQARVKEVKELLQWWAKNVGSITQTTVMDLSETDVESFAVGLTERFSRDQVNKHLDRLWVVIRFARRKPHGQRLDFDRQDVKRITGSTKKTKTLLTRKELTKLLGEAADRTRMWILLGLGCGFGNQDIASCTPACFHEDGFDLERGKTGLQRSGRMRPLVWDALKWWMEHSGPDKESDLLFTTPDGKPLVRHETNRKGTSVVRHDAVRLAWDRLKSKTDLTSIGGFYQLRHLAATALGAKPEVTLGDMRAFLGHSSGSDTVMGYMQPLRPQVRSRIEFINEMLERTDFETWKAELDAIRTAADARRQKRRTSSIRKAARSRRQ